MCCQTRHDIITYNMTVHLAHIHYHDWEKMADSHFSWFCWYCRWPSGWQNVNRIDHYLCILFTALEIKTGTFAAAVLMFLFMPLLVWVMPSKPEPYKKLRKETAIQKQLRKFTHNCIDANFMVSLCYAVVIIHIHEMVSNYNWIPVNPVYDLFNQQAWCLLDIVKQ